MARKTTKTAAAAAIEAPPAMDYPAHEKTWNSFVNVTKWSIGLAAVAVVILYFLINP